jgi:uncharacterized protein (UPF0335 family)
MTDIEERIENLPKWAQEYIEDLKCEIDRLEEECRDFAEEISDYENAK